MLGLSLLGGNDAVTKVDFSNSFLAQRMCIQGEVEEVSTDRICAAPELEHYALPPI